MSLRVRVIAVSVGFLGFLALASGCYIGTPPRSQPTTQPASTVRQPSPDVAIWNGLPSRLADPLRYCPANDHRQNVLDMQPCLSGAFVATLRNGQLIVEREARGVAITAKTVHYSDGYTYTQLSCNFGGYTFFAMLTRPKEGNTWPKWTGHPDAGRCNELMFVQTATWQIAVLVYPTGSTASDFATMGPLQGSLPFTSHELMEAITTKP